EDTEIDGWKIARGERVLLAFASANRDPEIFDDAETVKLARSPNRHMGFGLGIHRCLGSFLARMMFEVMVSEVLSRMPNYRIDERSIVPYTTVALVNGWIKMPASFA